ncbi:MAG TPA: response regulator [Pirellulales bacterium]|jgi:CheY-like chemotaxis protein/signal transduction histidine kinase
MESSQQSGTSVPNAGPKRPSAPNAIKTTVRRLWSGEALSPFVYAAIGLSTWGIFFADLYTPLGVAVWVFYLMPVVLTLFVWRSWAPPTVAIIVTALMTVGFFYSSLGLSPEVARLNRGFGIATVWIMAVVGYYFNRNKRTLRRQNWLQYGQTELSEVLGGEQRMEQLGENVLRFLAEYVDAQAGAFFAAMQGEFRRIATYGVPSEADIPTRLGANDGLLGQAVRDNRTFFVNDVPDGYLTFGSALVKGKPRHLVIVPVSVDGSVNAVFELGFVHLYNSAISELFERLSESIGVAVRSAHYRTHLQNLLEETQRQGEELQSQSEELRVSNEELEEQSRALKESQGRLEQQQAELEQTNVQLEEQTQILETQRDELGRTAERLQSQASELDQASRYKSDFLANMSHELRTPLNSSLILAKLLADNPHGNLTGEQVQFAETIRAAGNDLLTLINDILDLSKIEAGRMEVRPEAVPTRQMVDDLVRMFEPVAASKGLQLTADISPDCPEVIGTDRQRLEQILKNLLSNATKFTETGAVALRVDRSPAGPVEFNVTDTGIGIPSEQQQIIFEAFRQADGTTNRKYGGTGLGLSISRELARLLGGELRLVSSPDNGSTFTVSIPEVYDPTIVRPRDVVSPRNLLAEVKGTGTPRVKSTALEHGLLEPPTRFPRVADDRETLAGQSRIILVVEDDPPFAQILSSLVHELNFKCLIATTAEDALALAFKHVPNAVLLDIGLPDHSGLTVLDRLKHEPRTRHIPVHVVSASDDAETAMALGAVGYIIKPVEREKLVEAIQRLETRLAQSMRRVLVVEDDPVQLDSMRRLLGSHDVETVGVGTAAECLNLLKGQTFDCMVLDLSLPDATGYSLLETLSREDAYSFPPVIVYTGRDLSQDDEQRLRRYSKSIIIKGAKSPERLLDEVTLFLHQVVADLPPEHQRMLEKARSRDAALENRRILVVEDDVRNVFAVTSVLEPQGATVQIARNGREAIEAIEGSVGDPSRKIDLVLMDVMMPEMDGLTATRELRSRPEWKKLPIIMLTAKAMRDDQESCITAGANDYLAKPLDVEKLLSLVRVWMPR